MALHVLAGRGHALLVGVVHDLLQIIWMDGVQDIEEVLPGWAFSRRVRVREVRHQLRVLLELRIKGLDAELIVVRNLNGSDFRLLQQLLLAGHDGLQVVLVQDGLVGEVELDYKLVSPKICGNLRC